MKCPGQDPRYWKEDAIFNVECPHCGHLTEFFKDETRRRCEGCGERILNPKMDFGCAAYCKFAKDCFGEDLPPELIKEKENVFKDRVAVEMKLYFKTDFKRIGHAAKTARYTEQLVPKEKGNPAVALSAAYLRDVGVPEAERKHGSAAPQFQHQEGPAIARRILEKLDANSDIIDEVCDILGRRHTPGDEETANFKIVHDADLIVNLEEMKKRESLTDEQIETHIEERFLTKSGKELARTALLNTRDRGGAGGTNERIATESPLIGEIS